MSEQEPNFKERFKHLIMTGESVANEKRKAEIQPKIDMADKTFRFGLLFFFLLFWVIAIWRFFA